MIGIVVVSHSFQLARAAIELASEMVSEENRPALANAAGLDEETIGTDAMRVSEAIESVASDDGVLVFMDLGSAVLSTEMALEFLDPDLAQNVALTSAPFVEGLISAIVTASTGASLGEVAEEARAGLRGKQEAIGDVQGSAPVADPGPGAQAGPDAEPGSVADPGTGAGETRSYTITNEHGLHARPAAALVSGLRAFNADLTVTTSSGSSASAKSVTGLAALGIRQGETIDVVASGADASEALDALAALVASEFGEREPEDREPGENELGHTELFDMEGASSGASAPTGVVPKSGNTEQTDDPADVSGERTNAPSATGSEIVIAPAYVLSHDVDVSGYVPGDEQARLADARVEVANHLKSITGDQAAGIAQAQLAMLDDPEMVEAESAAIDSGATAPDAVTATWGPYAERFAALDDPYLAARAEDIRSISRMLIRALVGGELVPTIPDGSILVVEELDASTAATLDAARTPGIVTTRGGSSGHGVIVAKTRGIAILTGRADAQGVKDGDLLILDPLAGELVIRPDEQTTDAYRSQQQERQASIESAREHAAEPAVTRGGVRVRVEANVGSVRDAELGAAGGAEGSGLVRTELLWGDDAEEPTIEVQADTFARIARLMGHTITIRTWDVGADKPLAYMPLEQEDNPFLGVRGIRAMRLYPDLFTNQLRAVCRAAKQVAADGAGSIRVMLPMVSTPQEVRWGREMLNEAARLEGTEAPAMGIMLEVPAVALRAREFDGLVDFFSVGTNDLTQYTTAVDRGNGAVSELAADGRDAVLRLIEMAHDAIPHMPIAVCGDWASDTSLTADLIGRGVRELSARAASIALVKQAVRETP